MQQGRVAGLGYRLLLTGKRSGLQQRLSACDTLRQSEILPCGHISTDEDNWMLAFVFVSRQLLATPRVLEVSLCGLEAFIARLFFLSWIWSDHPCMKRLRYTVG